MSTAFTGTATWSRQIYSMEEWRPASVRSMYSTAADELIVTRALLGAILGVDMFTGDYIGVKIWIVNPRGGKVSVTIRYVNGLQVSLNSGNLPALITFQIRAGLDMQSHMVLGLIPGADGEMPELRREREAKNEQQDVMVGVLPAAITLTHAAAVKLAEDKAKELLELAKTAVLDGERDYWATDDPESKAVARAAVRRAMRNQERIPRVVGLYKPDFARAFVVEINECKPWNARFPRHPGFRLHIREGESVGVITQNGRVLYARPTWSWGLSFNLRCDDFQDFLEEADISMGDHVACAPVPIENVPDEERLAGVNHYFMIYKVPAPQVSKEDVLALWCELEAGADDSLPADDAAVNAVLARV